MITPVYNKSRNIEALLKRLVPVLERCAASFEIIFVDDGSTDDTLDRLRAAHAADPRIRALSLSRNFGKEIAIAAGLDHARGAATIIMDADLQHPPELIETFVARWREGYKNVFAQRVDRTVYQSFAAALDAALLQALWFGRRHAPAGGCRRFPPPRRAGRRGASRHARACAFFQGPLCLDRI